MDEFADPVEDMEEPATEEVEDDEDMPEPEDDDPGFDVDNPRFHGVLCVEGKQTGDKREFAPGALEWRDLPIPFRWQDEDTGGHNGAVVIGRIDSIWREGDELRYEGTFADTDKADAAIGLIAEEHQNGVSVDVDMAEMSLVDAEGATVDESDPFTPAPDDAKMLLTKGRISAATGVAIPAFAEAWVALGEWPAEDEDTEEPTEETEVGEALAADGSEEFKRGKGWITHPRATSRIHAYWTRGKGAAKIRWGTGGDFTRCRRQLAKYVNPVFLNRTCAQWHKDALGYWPGELGKPGNPPDTPENRRRAARHAKKVKATVDDCDECNNSVYLVASGETRTLPYTAFVNPKLDEPTAITVTDEGYIYGHLAAWGTCHIGFKEACVTAPESKANYAYFHTGVVETDGGEVPVGQITMNTGHADLSLRASDAAAHYDHTGATVADVHAGEDDHGIWIAGMLRPGVTSQQIHALKAASLSGDWRAIGGELELVAALAVNVPGFPIVRPSLAAAGGRQVSLVAADPVPQSVDNPVDINALAASVEQRIGQRAIARSLSERQRAERARVLQGRL